MHLKNAALVSVAYFFMAWLGLSVAPGVSNSITTIWAPSGIAATAVLLWGRPMLIGVYLGAFAINATTGDASLAAAPFIGLGNTLEAFVVTFLLGLLGFGAIHMRPADAGRLAFAAGLGCLVAANVGTATLYLTGALAVADYPVALLTWWLGDTLGVLLLVPALLFFLAPHEQ